MATATNIIESPMSIFRDSATFVLIGGIPVSDEGTREGYDKDGAYAVRTLRCRWTDRQDLARYLRSPSIASGGSTTVGFGQPYPDDPSMFVQSISIRGDGAKGLNPQTNLISYSYAVLEVAYRSGFTPYETGTLSVSFESEVVSVPQSGSWLYYDDGQTSLGKPKNAVPFVNTPRMIIPVLVISRSLTRVVKFPQAKFTAALQAPVNSTVFDISAGSFKSPDFPTSLNQAFQSDIYSFQNGLQQGNLTGLNAAGSFPIATTRFCGGECNKIFIVGGYTYWNSNYLFKVRLFKDNTGALYDWNSVIDVNGKIKKIIREDFSPMFPMSDLNQLFTY